MSDDSLARDSASVLDRSAAIVVMEGPAVAGAAQLAAGTGRDLRIVTGPVLQSVNAFASCDSPQIFVALCEEADDALLFGLLDHIEEALGSERPLFDLPHFTILTARDPASLATLVARLIAAARRLPAESIRMRHYAPSPEATEVTHVEIGAGRMSYRRESLTAAPLLASYASPAAVVAFSTHGSESCAKGGDGTVLCGLHSQGLTDHEAGEGMLACGHGHVCPRGPHPMPLRRMGADVMLLGSCNGLRLADSLTRPQFNFALSFVDGPGLAFVSTLFSSIGGDVASLAFLSAMSSGCTLGEATTLTNALLYHTALERTSYVAVGDVSHRASGADRPAPAVVDALPALVHFGSVHFAELHIRDEALCDAARRDLVTLGITSDREGSPFGFHRPERDGEGSYLAVYLFAFPEPLGTVRVAAANRVLITEEARSTLEALSRWVDLWRLAELDAEEPEAYDDLRAAADEARRMLSRTVARLSIDGGVVEDVVRQTAVAGEIANIAAAQLVQHLAPKLGGAFWLSNLYTTDRFERSENAPCPSCGHAALARTLCHAITGAARAVVVCPRCGIASDIPQDSQIDAVAIEMTTLAVIGEELTVTIAVTTRRPTLLAVYPRLSTYDEVVPLPVPESTCMMAEPGTTRIPFVFRAPEGLLPHRYYVKVLIASETGLAFASRPLFVVPER